MHVLETPEDAAQIIIERQLLWNNQKQLRGPFDIIGDIHGCYDELIALLEKLGYNTNDPDRVVPPPGPRSGLPGGPRRSRSTDARCA